MDRKNENDPEGEVGEHLFGRQPDQFGTIIDAFEMHTGRQDSRSIDLVHLCFNAADGRRGLLAAAHQHNALHDVVVVVLAGDAEARREALLDVGDIAHERGGSARRRHYRVANGVHGLDERDPAYDRGVLAEIQGLSADVQIVVVESLDDLRQGQSRIVQPL